MGDIRCGKTSRGKYYPSLLGYTTIPAFSRGAGNYKLLSPMKYDPNIKIEIIEPLPLRPGFEYSHDKQYCIGYCNIFENYWQSGKIYQCDLINTDKPITIDNLKDSFWIRRKEMFNLTEGKRRSLPKAKYGVPISSYYRGIIMDYITSRYYVYCPLYQKMYQNLPVYQDLLKRYLKGENLLIIGPDGGNENIPLSLDYLDQLINDSSKIFGHEFVLCAMLLGKNYLLNS
jgi:hypothetical protein